MSNDESGYGKPPKASQFTKGKSGNPAGRPKGAKNFSTVLDKELNARVPITENGSHKTVSKQEAIAKQLVNKSASGDARSMSMVLGEIRQLEEKTISSADEMLFSGKIAEKVLQHFLERYKRTLEAQIKENNESPEKENE